MSSVVATQRQLVKIVETGQTIQMTSPDQVLLSGVLQSGAVASVHIKGGTANGTGFLFEVHVIAPTDPRQGTSVQISEFTLGSTPVPAGPPFNVAQLFVRMAEGIRERKSVSPDFDVAVKRHQLPDAIQNLSDTGLRQVL